MKYYVDYNNGQIKIDVEKEFYQSENLENKITVLLTNVADPEDEVVPAYFLSIEFLRSDGRKCTIQTADAFGEEEDTTLTEDDITYDIHNFTLTEQVLKCAGTLMFTVYINFVNSDTGKVTRRGVIFNGVNNVKKTVPYSTNSLLVIDDESEAEDNVTNILDELTAINAALATKQKKLVLPYNSGLTMTDSYKLSVKGNENKGIQVNDLGVGINYDIDEFQVIKISGSIDGSQATYDTKILKNAYFNNTSPINKRILNESPYATGYKYKDNLTVATSSGSLEGRTKYTYTFSGRTAKKIKANYSHEWYGTTNGTMYTNGTWYPGNGAVYNYDTNLTPNYSLTFDSSETVCSQFLTHLVKRAIDREYTLNLDTDAYTNITLPSNAIVIFNPIGKVGDIVYFSCPNLVCKMTPTLTIPQVLSVVLGLKESGDNYIVEFDVDDVTGTPATISNNTTVHCLTGMVYDVSVTEDYLGVGYKYISLKTSSQANNFKKLIEIDFAPTADSEHLVFSGGVKTAIDSAVASLDEAKQDVIDSTNKVNADYVDDTNATHKFATAEQLAQIAANASEISKIKSVQNCVDTVATYSALQSYVTTNLDVNDKIQVIADENYSNATTIYNWTGSAWEYVGAYGGNSYTKTQTDTLLDGKQNVIDSNHKLSSDSIDDSNAFSDHKFVSADEKLEVSRLSSILIEKNYNQTASDYLSNLTEVSITGYISQADWNSLTERTSVTVALNFTDYTLAFNLRPQLSTVKNLIVEGVNFRGTANSPVSDGGMFEIEGSITSDREYTFTFKGFKVYTEGEVDALLASKQDVISGSTSIDITSNVVSVKDSYVEGFFATSQEIDNMLEEVFG